MCWVLGGGWWQRAAVADFLQEWHVMGGGGGKDGEDGEVSALVSSFFWKRCRSSDSLHVWQ